MNFRRSPGRMCLNFPVSRAPRSTYRDSGCSSPRAGGDFGKFRRHSTDTGWVACRESLPGFHSGPAVEFRCSIRAEAGRPEWVQRNRPIRGDTRRQEQMSTTTLYRDRVGISKPSWATPTRTAVNVPLSSTDEKIIPDCRGRCEKSRHLYNIQFTGRRWLVP